MARSINPRPAPVVACAVLVILSLLGGCQAVRGDPEPAAAPTPTTIAPYSSARLATELDAALRQVRTVIDNVAAAKTFRLLDWELGIARDTIRDQGAVVKSLPGSEGVKAALGELGAALSNLRLEVDQALDAVDKKDVCAAPAAMAMIGSVRTRESLQSATEALATATGGAFKPVEILPPKVARQNRSLANGVLVRGRPGPGSNYIFIDNRRGTVDLVLTLSRGDRPVYSIYAKRKRAVTVRGIADGTYRTQVTEGRDWDRELRGFTRDCTFFQYSGTIRLGVAPKHFRGWRYRFNVPVKPGSGSSGEYVHPQDSIPP